MRCEKKTYFKRHLAEAALDRAVEQGLTTLNIYWCKQHKGFHLGHRRRFDKMVELFKQRGFSTRMFDPAGQDDIGGGCGQLWFVQEWMKNNPKLARPSIGNGKHVVHTPAAVVAE